ncbi:MAG: glutamate--cysteine ligase [Nocardioides sp.]
MPNLSFVPSRPSTLGVEVELFIIDGRTMQLANAASRLLDEVGPIELASGAAKVKHEAFEHTIEMVTDVCTTVAEAKADLAQTLARLQEGARALGLRLISCGTHPISDWRTAELTRDDRYELQLNETQWIARRAQICSAHYHVGVDNADKAIAVVNTLMFYHPYFLALTASSPYYERDDTGLASCRTTVLEAMPTAGFPHLLSGWDEFAGMYDSLLSAGAIDSIRAIWWDVRPHPEFGTVELRMCDGPSTLGEVGAVAALAQCLVTRIATAIDEGEPLPSPPRWILRENKWLAARYGLDAAIVVNQKGERKVLREALPALLADLAPTAAKLGCTEELASVARIVEHGASYERQRRMVADGATLYDVVHALVGELETNSPNGVVAAPGGAGATSAG